MNSAEQKSKLRKQLRIKRRSLTPAQQETAALNLTQVVRRHLGQQRRPRIALYLAQDGEIDLANFSQYCLTRNIELYLPVLHSFKPTLWFARYDAETPLFNNRFGIPEPLKSEAITPWQLSLVLMPLVGFDPQGGRLGMGGGFYDRTFAHRQRWPKQPKFFGVAHECQKQRQIPIEPWDVPLDGVFTDKSSYLI